MMYLSHIYGTGKSRYRFLSNLAYCMKEMWKWKKTVFLFTLFSFIPGIAADYLGALLPSWVVADLESGADVRLLLFHIFLLCAFLWLGNVLSGCIHAWFSVGIDGYLYHFRRKFLDKIMDVDYDRLEDGPSREVTGNVISSVKFGRGLYFCASFMKEVPTAVILLLFYGVLISRVRWWLFVVIMLTVLIDLKLLGIARKKHREYYGKTSLSSRRTDYINTQAGDAAAGKDIRMYQLLDFLIGKYDAALGELERIFGAIHCWYTIRNVTNAFLLLFRNWAAYGLLLVLLAGGELSASEFVYYIGLVSSFALYFEMLIRQLMNINSTNASVSYIREFLGWQDTWKRTDGIGAEALAKLRRSPVSLELRNVSFTYPGNERETLSDISLTIRPGEKLALLGLNGAGKTTLVKLICGFYHPTKGEILLGGIPIERFTREEYLSCVSVLFQDYTLLPVTLDENLTGGGKEDIDRNRLERDLTLSGFAERYEKTPGKGEASLIREVNGDSVDFSGGEKQKLLFTRALYKEAPLIILDEPTAALDPIAENELYLRYGEAMKNATSIFISHRLSSTRFCDRIVLLENGRLIEEGTHEQLLAGATRYAYLYEIQSRYYKSSGNAQEKKDAASAWR